MTEASDRSWQRAGNAVLSVVIPVYNEAENLVPLYEDVTDALLGLQEPFEILFVDDGSSDRSPEILRELAAKEDSIKVIYFRRNFGQTAAMMAGIDYASGDVIVVMDGDGQNDPADIPALLDKLAEGYDVVSGWRQKRRDDRGRIWVSRIANRLISWASGVHLHDYGCSLKAYRRDVIKSVRLYGEMHRFIPPRSLFLTGRACAAPRTTASSGSSRSSWTCSWCSSSAVTRPSRCMSSAASAS